MIGYFSGDELPFIKSFGITEQCFNMGDDNILAEFINHRMIFLFNMFYNSIDCKLLFFGKK